MSGRKSQLPNYQIITNGDMTSNVTSAVTSIEYQDNVSVVLKWTGTPVGTMAIQGSNDNSTWVNLPVEPPISVSGSADTVYADLNQLPCLYIRVVYTAGSSSGTLNGFISGKQI